MIRAFIWPCAGGRWWGWCVRDMKNKYRIAWGKSADKDLALRDSRYIANVHMLQRYGSPKKSVINRPR